MQFFKPLAAAGLALICASAWASDSDLVKYRQRNMEILGGHMGSIGDIMKGKVPYTSDLATHADGLAATAKLVKEAFKQEATDKDSEAKPEIWKDWASFEKKADDLETASNQLSLAVKSGDQGAIGAAVAGVGKSCKGCHEDYKKD